MVEISRSDLIPRPENVPKLPPGDEGGGFDLKGIIDQVKKAGELIEELRKLSGGKLDEIFPRLANIKGKGGTTSLETKDRLNTPQAQFALFIRLLQEQYGDITINQLLEKLKSDMGNKRLSEFTGKK